METRHNHIKPVDLTNRSVSISLPSSPSELKFGNNGRGRFRGIPEDDVSDLSTAGDENAAFGTKRVNKKTMMKKFHSKSMPRGSLSVEIGTCRNLEQQSEEKDKRYDMFRTWSGKLERQISNLRGKPSPTPRQAGEETLASENRDISQNLTVDRYFDALEGPELETLRPTEKILLPEDTKWPFLLRFPITSFGICLGVSSQAIMWKNLATTKAEGFLHISHVSNHILWWISLLLLLLVSSTYLLKMILYFEAVRREYYHPVRVNFFFAPWISILFLAMGVPPSVATSLPPSLWYVLMFPILCLELKIYGQWVSGGERRLSKVANPTNHLSIVGNFVGALLGASMGLKEGPVFFFGIGLAHYIVLFVTLYQRLPTNETLPKEHHPVFFLFVAAPSVASMAWSAIIGSFDFGSRIAFFLALFLYFSLVVRVNFFRGFKFSLAWWAYTFPMTAAAIATIKYSGEVTNVATQILCVILSGTATITVIALLITTLFHAFVKRDLFPNDIAIAISQEQPKRTSLFCQLRQARQQYLRFSTTNTAKEDIEAPANPLHPEKENEMY